jgi:hypothetical protein
MFSKLVIHKENANYNQMYAHFIFSFLNYTHANQSAEIKYLHVFVFVLLYNYIKNVECIPSQWIYNDVLGPASWTFSPLDSPNYHKNNRQD